MEQEIREIMAAERVNREEAVEIIEAERDGEFGGGGALWGMSQTLGTTVCVPGRGR